MMSVLPEFAPRLEPFDPASLERHPSSVCGVWRDLTLAYVNPAWTDFAAANGGLPAISERWPLGSNLESAIPAVLRPFYRALFDVALEPEPREAPVRHLYECSSPELFRQFQMSVHRLGDGDGLLLSHALVVERPHVLSDRPPLPPNQAAYRQSDGMIHQCVSCRRTRRAHDPAGVDRVLLGRDPSRAWDWVPAWVERVPPRTSHTICLFCRRDYFERAGFPSPPTSEEPPSR